MKFLKEWKTPKTLPTYNVDIYIAGEYKKIKEVAGAYCQNHGFCFSLVKTDYVYTNRSPLNDESDLFFKTEEGAKITLINYPRFPITKAAMDDIAMRLAKQIADICGQGSFSIVSPDYTTLHSRRKDD